MEEIPQVITSTLERSMRQECKKKKKKRDAQDFSCFKLVNPQRKSSIILKSMKMVRTVK